MDEVMGSQWWAKQVRLMGLTVEWWRWNHLIRQQDAGQIHPISISAEIQAKTAHYKVPWERLLPSDDWLARQASANRRSAGLNQKLKVKSRVPGKPMPLVLALSLITFRELGCPEIQILDLPLIRPFDLGKDNFSKPQLPYLYNGNKSRKVVRIKWGVIQVNRVGCIKKMLTLFFLNLSSLKQIWIRTGDCLSSPQLQDNVPFPCV